ncbi:hypothetical protein [Algibacillus agarilyticus]|uniref:hypothetical protein n=1 Tax=Algibacillus agarilyticus TaxID=2234133 RepID=UPI000DD038EF|nr:hypothetical protein [Algibacillus agarilyticus]
MPDINKKLVVLFRVEPGSLGPDGIDKVERFCLFAQQEVSRLNSAILHIKITPRYDKTLAEMEYSYCGKRLTHEQAEKYMDTFKGNLEELELALADKISLLIDTFLAS